MATSMAYGPAAGLALADLLVNEPSLHGYHPLPGVRADLLFKLGRLPEALAEYQRAASLTGKARERQMLLGRVQECGSD